MRGSPACEAPAAAPSRPAGAEVKTCSNGNRSGVPSFVRGHQRLWSGVPVGAGSGGSTAAGPRGEANASSLQVFALQLCYNWHFGRLLQDPPLQQAGERGALAPVRTGAGRDVPGGYAGTPLLPCGFRLWPGNNPGHPSCIPLYSGLTRKPLYVLCINRAETLTNR